MNVLVLVKQTFDTEEKIIIQNGEILEEGVNFIINPYDEYAIEEAIKIKEKFGGEITVLSVGPERVESALRTALAMGADKGLLIELKNRKTDEYTLAKIMASAIKESSFDLILGGNMAIDSGAGQVAIRLAEELGIPHVSAITKLSLLDQKATVERDVEGDFEVLELNLPFLATAQQGLNEPRYPSLPGIMKAKKKPLKKILVEDLGLSTDQLEPKTLIQEQYLPSKKKSGKILQGETRQQIGELVQLLRNEAKVI
jgi:electron transfer flavoprotein beta subunit